jgi:hypothetical protein
MDGRIAAAEQLGKSVLDALPARADATDALLAQLFATSVADFRAAARASAAPKKSNPELIRRMEAVHGVLVAGVADLRALEYWLSTRVPSISDGNNFGVEVQHHVIEQIKAMRSALGAHADVSSSYLNKRGQAVEKVGPSKSTETSAVETSETKTEDGAPKTTSTKKSEKTDKVSAKDDVEDFVNYIVELDVKQYVALEGMVRDLTQTYVCAYEVVQKNRAKCENPRGELTGGGRMNSMY